MERSDLPTADTSRTPPHLHQARAGALPLPAAAAFLPAGGLRGVFFSTIGLALLDLGFHKHKVTHFMDHSPDGG